MTNLIMNQARMTPIMTVQSILLKLVDVHLVRANRAYYQEYYH